MQIKCFNKSAERFLWVDRSQSDFLHIFLGQVFAAVLFLFLLFLFIFCSCFFFFVSSASVPIASHASNLRRGRGRALVLLSYSQHTARLTASPGQWREVEKRNETKRSIASPPHNILCVCVCECVAAAFVFFYISLVQAVRAYNIIFVYL